MWIPKDYVKYKATQPKHYKDIAETVGHSLIDVNLDNEIVHTHCTYHNVKNKKV